MREMTSIRLERDGNLFSQARQKLTLVPFLFVEFAAAAAAELVGALEGNL